MPALVDTHCHLDFKAFDSDRNAVLDRAAQAGIERIVNPGIDLKSSREIIALAEANQPVYAAIGVHPNDAETWTDDTLEQLWHLAANPKVVALGEIGLDYYREYADPGLQREVLRQQLELAAELSLPVIIHNRDASKDVLEILQVWQAQLAEKGSPLAERPGVLHSFSADVETAIAALRSSFYIGITGPVTFRNAETLRQVVQALPLEKILIETDAPFLTPHPYRGKRNEPAYVQYVAGKIAEIHSLKVEDVAEATTRNAFKLFNW